MKTILEPFQDEDVTLIVPEHSLAEFHVIDGLLTTKNIAMGEISNMRGLLKTLQIPYEDDCSLSHGLEAAPVPEVTLSPVLVEVPASASAAPPPLPEYLKTIPDIPTDIETAELFDPDYLDDIEIENEENLSLTIHSTETEYCVVPPSKRKSKTPSKCSVVIKRKLKKGKSNSVSKKKNLKGDPSKFQEEVKAHVCPFCHLKFSSDIELLLHKKAHLLQDQRNMVCSFCGKYFKRMFQLQNHIRKHTGDKPFVCHTCGKAFSQETSLKTHMRIHSGVKPFKCKECNESFNVSSALTAHKMWKHNEGNRPFLCSFCSKSFPTKSAVRKHETIHKSDKKHFCNFCEKKFARADHLKSHLKSHNKDETQT